MLTASVKTTKTKILGTVCVVLAFVIAAILFFGTEKEGKTAESISLHVSTNEERVGYIASKGLKIAVEPYSVEDVMLPEEPDEILLQYNEIQKKSGFDLSPYYGETVKKYVYSIAEKEETFVTLFVFEEKIIGADVACHIEGWQRPIDAAEELG